MAREWFDDPDTRWEALTGCFPVACLDRHPSGNFVALQIVSNDIFINERAAIWETKTRKVAYAPENAKAICWIERGSELLVLETIHRDDVERPPLFVTPLQREYQHFIRRVSWPGFDTISVMEIKFPMGWLVDIIPSPAEPLACFVWQDQCESGIEFVTWEQGTLLQVRNRGYFADSNFIQGPVFNEDGTVLAMSFGAGCWWSETPYEPSPGGSFRVGYVIWTEVKSGQYHRKDIDVVVPEGWRPEDLDDSLHTMCLSQPIFISSNEIKILVPTKEEHIVSFGGYR